MAPDLHNRPVLHRRRKGFVVIGQHLVCELTEGIQLVPPNVVAAAFGKAVDEERPLAAPEQNDAAKAARSALPLPGNALLDDPATEVGVDQPPLSAANRIA
jgi:hypothetical protein